jgi:hypothetical protein
MFRVPAGLSPVGIACLETDPDIAASCLSLPRPPGPATVLPTYVGTYQPAAYLVPGLATLGAHDVATALARARLANAALWLGLVVMAVVLLADGERPGLSVLGVVLAVTPMTVFLGASVSSSGPEVAAAVCFLAAVIRLCRPGRPPAAAWPALAVSGALLAFTRSLGPGWVVFGAVVAVVSAGPRGAVRAVRQGGRAAAVALATVAVASVASVAWEATAQPHAAFGWELFRRWLGPSVRELPTVVRENVGVFGPLNVSMRPEAYLLWVLLAMLLVVAALVLGRGRERAAVVLTLVAWPAGAVVLSAAVIHQTGFGMQGRYVAPLVLAVPLVAGEVVLRHRARVSAEVAAVTVGVVTAAAAVVHLLGWYANARRWAVGTNGPRLFLGRAAWAPPGGWWAWLATACAGAALLAAAGVTLARREAERR